MDRVASCLSEERFNPGDRLVVEGDIGDRLYLLVEGRAEVSITTPAGPVTMATLGPGELFGEMALLNPPHRRQATVTALTPLLALALAAPVFGGLISSYPDIGEALSAVTEDMAIGNFLKRASPFASLDAALLRSLGERLERKAVPEGATIVRQGEPGDACYLISSGRVEVLAEGGETSGRRLATLGPGTLFGEAALLTGAPRNATVRALEPCQLLMLRREDLLEAMISDRGVAARMVELLHLRDRPRRFPHVLAEHRSTEDGDDITVLKDPRRSAYYRLSAQGWFIWQRLDGRHSLRDLTMDYLTAFKSFAPQAIAETIGGLAAAGFVTCPALRADVVSAGFQAPWWARAMVLSRRLLEWRLALPGVDAPLTRLYSGGVRMLYTLSGQLALAGLALAGLLALVVGIGRAELALGEAGGASLLFLIPAYLLAVILHEAGHAFTVKAFGREVPRAGIGWYWFGPVAFVDTTDMWMAGRWPRIAVSLAGPYANMLLAGAAALGAWLVPDQGLAASLWQFSLVSYLMVLLNLNPLLEYDGYYVLMDALDRPNLRPDALSWIGRKLPVALRQPGEIASHWLELLYGIASLLYVALMAVLVIVLYRLYLLNWMAQALPAEAAEALAWVLATVLVALSAVVVASELRGAPHREPGTTPPLF